jgi:CRP-like cAMP-binding protein
LAPTYRHPGGFSLAHLLLELFYRVRARRLEPEGENKIDFPLTQEQIADACGLTNIHVNRTLSALKGDNLLVWKDKVLTIPDPQRLA